MSAAFDTVDHDILIQRLSASFGIKDRALSWLDSYIKGRTQSVHFSGEETPPRLVTCGVPQGSVLGPLLFVLYTADMERIIKAHGLLHHCYADDTQLYFFCEPSQTAELKQRVLLCIQSISKWWPPTVSSSILRSPSSYGAPPTDVAIYLTAVPSLLVMQKFNHLTPSATLSPL